MRISRFFPIISPGQTLTALLLLSLLIVVTGCPPRPAPVEPSPSAPTAGDPVTSTNRMAGTSPDIVLVGNRLTLALLDVPESPPPIELQVREDGTLSLPRISQSIKAAGKRIKDLETEIQALYVPSFYTRCTVVLRLEERYYSVQGQVNRPGAILYTGGLTTLKAIAAAGGFTDFANRAKVQVTRSNGQIFEVNCKKALKDPRLDLEIYSDDTIYVHRAIWW